MIIAKKGAEDLILWLRQKHYPIIVTNKEDKDKGNGLGYNMTKTLSNIVNPG